MIIHIKNPYYFERGTMSLSPTQKLALDTGSKLIVEDNESGERHKVDSNIARATIRQVFDRFTDEVYYVARFK